MSGKRSRRPSCASCAAVKQAQPITRPMTMNAKKLRIEIIRDPLGRFLRKQLADGKSISANRYSTSLRAAASKIKWISPALRVACRPHRLLTIARGSQHFVKGCFCAELCQQRIGKQILVGAIVLPDRALQQMKSRLLLASVCEKRSLVIPRLRIGVSG